MLYHADAYRLRSAAELTALGIDELIRSDSAVVVEWADRVRDALPPETVWIDVAPLGETTRRFTFRAGDMFRDRLVEAFGREYEPPIDADDAGE